MYRTTTSPSYVHVLWRSDALYVIRCKVHLASVFEVVDAAQMLPHGLATHDALELWQRMWYGQHFARMQSAVDNIYYRADDVAGFIGHYATQLYFARTRVLMFGK